MRWSTIESPVNGLVFAVHQQQGELASNAPSSPVLTLLDPTSLQVHLYTDESDFGQVGQDQEVTFQVDAFPDRVFNGRVARILPRPILQENVVYYLMVVEVDASQRHLLRAEMTALGHIRAGVREKALWLPVPAVRSRVDGWYVVRSTPTGLIEAPVHIGWKVEGRVEIVEGLSEGDAVALEP